jgi:hypothetical protein
VLFFAAIWVYGTRAAPGCTPITFLTLPPLPADLICHDARTHTDHGLKSVRDAAPKVVFEAKAVTPARTKREKEQKDRWCCEARSILARLPPTV